MHIIITDYSIFCSTKLLIESKSNYSKKVFFFFWEENENNIMMSLQWLLSENNRNCLQQKYYSDLNESLIIFWNVPIGNEIKKNIK